MIYILIVVFLLVILLDCWVTVQNTRELREHNRQRDGREMNTPGDPLGITQPTDTKGLF